MDSEAVAQVGLGVCAVSVLGGFQAPTCPSPEQPGLTPELPCFGHEVGLEASEGPSQLELFCDRISQ